MKTSRICLVTLLIIFNNCFLIYSQQVISNMGANLQTASGSISFTLGEAVVATFSNTSGIITQGFHQTRLTIIPIDENSNNSINVKVFPNPTADFLNVYLDVEDSSNISLVITNLNGSILFTISADNELIEIDFSNYITGIYILMVIKDYVINGTYKIVKQ